MQHPIVGSAVLEVFAEASRALRFGAAVTEFAEILRGSTHSEGRRFDTILDVARGAAHAGDRDQAEFIELVDRAKGL